MVRGSYSPRTMRRSLPWKRCPKPNDRRPDDINKHLAYKTSLVVIYGAMQLKF